jgi:tetratricopeptide (TPR) repeat protein
VGPVSSDQVLAHDAPREPADGFLVGEAAVQRSLDAARAADHAGLYIAVLDIMAVLAAGGVRRALLHAAGQTGVLVRGRRVPADEVDRALTQLADRSLLTLSPDGQTVSMPDPVAQVVRAKLIERGDSAPQVIEVGEPLTAELERVLGPDHPDTLNARDSLAAAYQAAGRAAEAILLFEDILVARERILGPKHPDTLTSQNNLAATYQDADRFAEAILLFKLTLAARERLFGADHDSTLNSRADLAAAFRATGRVSEAIPLLEQTVAERERVLGADHPDVRAARDNLAAARQEKDQTDETLQIVLLAEPPPAVAEQQTAEEQTAQKQAAEQEPAEDPVEFPAAPSSDDAAPESIPEQPVAPADEEKLLAAPPAEEPSDAPLPEEPPAVAAEVEAAAAPADGEEPAAAAAETDDQASPEPASVPEPEPQQDVSASAPRADEPSEAAAAAEPPTAQPPAVPAAEEPPDAPPAEEPSAPPAGRWPPSARDRSARRRRRVLSLVAAVVIVFAAGGVAGFLSRLHAGHSGHGSAASRSAGSQPLSAASQLAAVWVAHQVARSTIVACDPLMCSALEAHGVPAANLMVLRADAASPLGAQVVVVTPAVRSQFGSRMDSVYAPSVIAGFGSGPGQVSVQVVAKDGPVAYLTALRQDVAARKVAGAQLLANKHIQASAEAWAQLAAGAVDARLLIMLPALAGVHPIQVLAFGGPAPGSGPGVPLCSAELSGSGHAASMSDVSYLRWLTSFIGTQLVPFAGNMSVLQEAGQPIVRVVFAQPSPLGLLSHT